MGLKVERATDVVHLFTRQDRAELARLAQAIEEAVAAKQLENLGPRRKGDNEQIGAAEAQAYDDFMAGAVERAVHVKITALRGPEWRNLLATHPPRPDVKDAEGNVTDSFPQDHREGFNVESLARPLVLLSIDLDQFDGADPEAERVQYVDDLSDPDFSRIYSAAVRLNTEAGPDPKWSASSWLDRMSVVMSRSDSPSDETPTSSTDSPSRVGDSSEQSG